MTGFKVGDRVRRTTGLKWYGYEPNAVFTVESAPDSLSNVWLRGHDDRRLCSWVETIEPVDQPASKRRQLVEGIKELIRDARRMEDAIHLLVECSRPVSDEIDALDMELEKIYIRIGQSVVEGVTNDLD